MFRHQSSIEYRFPKYQAHHNCLFKRQCQNPHLGILGSLVFCVGLTLSEPAWSVPSVEPAALSVSKIDQRVSTVVTTASTDSDAVQSPAGELPQTVRGEALVDHDAQQGESPTTCDTEESRSLGLGASDSSPSLQSRRPTPSENSENPPSQPPLESVSEVTGQQMRTHQESVESPVLSPESGLPSQYSNLAPKLTSSRCQTNDLLEAEGRGQEAGGIYADASGRSDLSTDREQGFQAPSKSPIWGHSFKGVANPRLNETSCLLPSTSCLLQTQTTVSPIPGASVLGTQHSGLLTQDSQQQKQQSHPKPLSSPREVANSPIPEIQPSPRVNSSESEQPSNSADPELGNLRLRELPTPPLPSKPAVFLLGGVSYFRSNNIFSGVNPVDDGLVGAGLTLLTTPSLGPQTSLFASVNGNIIRYTEQSQFDYNELRFNLGLHQKLSSRSYGEVGWSNRKLFENDGGEQFLNEHSLYLQLGRRDLLAKQLTLDTFYQFRFSFADPSNRTQAINYLGASLGYNVNPSLQVGLDYQFALANFTEQERLDQYHQLIARLTYTMSPNSQLYLFGGHSFGSSSDPYVDFNGLVFGVGVNLNVTLF